MRSSLQQICNDFIVNRDIVKKVFKVENIHIYSVCADIFCSRGAVAGEDKLVHCKQIVKQKTGLFSNFRGNVLAPISSMLAAGENPEGQLDKALVNYGILKKNFRGSEYLSLVAFLLTDMVKDGTEEEKAIRGKNIYNRMKKEHPFLTSGEDSVFAVLMAFLDKTDDEMIADMEGSYRILNRKFSSKNSIQSVSHVLAFADGTAEEKAGRVISLYDSILGAGRKYGKYYELATLGAVSVLDVEISQLVSDILEVDDFLSHQKGYRGLGIDKKTRMMHAAMLVANDYSPHENVETAALTGTISMIAAQQAAMCAIIASTAATTTAASN